MVSFRPHTIRRIRTDSFRYDENGDFVQSGKEYDEPVECRYESNGRASTIVLGDGKVYAYSYSVYLSVDCPEFSYGDSVEIFDSNGNSMGIYTVQGFRRGQLNSMLWL